MKRNVNFLSREKFQKRHGDGICFLSGGASGDPDADRFLDRPVLNESGKYFLLQGFEGFRVAEERRDIDKEVVIERIDFVRIVAKMAEIHFQAVGLREHHTARDPPADCAEFIIRKIDVRPVADEEKDFLQVVLTDRLGFKIPRIADGGGGCLVFRSKFCQEVVGASGDEGMS